MGPGLMTPPTTQDMAASELRNRDTNLVLLGRLEMAEREQQREIVDDLEASADHER